jgi:hypothetical protein
LGWRAPNRATRVQIWRGARAWPLIWAPTWTEKPFRQIHTHIAWKICTHNAHVRRLLNSHQLQQEFDSHVYACLARLQCARKHTRIMRTCFPAFRIRADNWPKYYFNWEFWTHEVPRPRNSLVEEDRSQTGGLCGLTSTMSFEAGTSRFNTTK